MKRDEWTNMSMTHQTQSFDLAIVSVNSFMAFVFSLRLKEYNVSTYYIVFTFYKYLFQ